MDEESYYSVTPEVISTWIARQFDSCGVVVDFCCAVGGNTLAVTS